MDALAEFTAMSPPADDGGEDTERETCGSSQLLDDSFTTQCSADPSAFVGFTAAASAATALTRSITPLVSGIAGQDRRMKLVLDLKAPAASRQAGAKPESAPHQPPSPSESEQFGGSHFRDLFSTDTQDDVGLETSAVSVDAGQDAAVSVTTTNADSTGGQRRPKHDATPSPPEQHEQHGQQRTSPPPSFLFAVESEWRRRRMATLSKGDQISDDLTDESLSSPSRRLGVRKSPKKAELHPKDGDRRESIPGSSEYSEDLARFDARTTQFAWRSTRTASTAALATEHEDSGVIRLDDEKKGDDSDRETTVSSAEGLEDIEPHGDASLQSEVIGEVDDNAAADDELTQVDSLSDTGTEPYTASGDEDDGVGDEVMTEPFLGMPTDTNETETVMDDRRVTNAVTPCRDSSTSAPDGGEYHSRHPNAESIPDSEDVTLASFAKAPHAAHQASANSAEGETHAFRGAVANDDDEYPPTQPSKVYFSKLPPSESLPSSSLLSDAASTRVALKKRGKQAPPVSVVLTDSQENSYEFDGSACKCGERVCRCETALSVEQSTGVSPAIRNLEFSFAVPESQETESSQKYEIIPDIDLVASKTLNVLDKSESGPATLGLQHSSGRKRDYAEQDFGREKTWKRTPTTSRTTSSSYNEAGEDLVIFDSRSEQVQSTPISARKRKRTEARGTTGESMVPARDVTPSRPLRDSNNIGAALATPSSAQKVRTRTKMLSPLPSNRAYASRSRTIFKYKFEFVLTGFVKEGDASLSELIEEHGGKVMDRYQDVLYRGNGKALVIATPVSWRKRKFMQAISCGIPVVHPDWIQSCIKEACVVPFDGYFVPSGYSVTTRKFECLGVKEVRLLVGMVSYMVCGHGANAFCIMVLFDTQLNIFNGYSFGIACDVDHAAKNGVREMASIMTFILKACGAYAVHEVRSGSIEYCRVNH